MKKTIALIVVVFAFAIQVAAQIPNNGFEAWTTKGLYEEPNNWASFNSICPTNFHSCTKSTDHYPVTVGSYSVRLENNTSLTQPTGSYGALFSDLTISYPFRPSFPVTGHPNSFTGYFKYDSKNSDSLFIKATLFKNGIIVSNTQYETSLSGIWKSFSIDFPTYTDADSCSIYFMAFYPNGPTAAPKGNSVLYIDNINFDALISGQKEVSVNMPEINLFPNPANELININSENFHGQVSYALQNIMGQDVLQGTFAESTNLPVNGLPTGIYTISLYMDNSILVKKLIINR